MGLQVCTCLISSLRDRTLLSHSPQGGTQAPTVWVLTHHWCSRPQGLPSRRSTAKVFVWLGLWLFVPVSIGTASLGRPLLHPSQLPSPCLAVLWPSPSRQLVMF